MSYLKYPFVAITLVLGVGSISYAETVADNMGVGLDLSESFTLSINGRLKGKSNSANFSNVDKRAYDDYRLDLSSFAAMIDWHPGDGGFRVSAGLLYNGKEADNATYSSVVSPNYLINDQNNTAVEMGGLTGRINSDSTAPYLGVGWRNKADEQGGFSFSAEAGLLFQGGSTSRLDAQHNLITNQDYLQEEGGLEDFLDNVEIYPVLNLGISYTY
jgi:hypothetical protein